MESIAQTAEEEGLQLWIVVVADGYQYCLLMWYFNWYSTVLFS